MDLHSLSYSRIDPTPLLPYGLYLIRLILLSSLVSHADITAWFFPTLLGQVSIDDIVMLLSVAYVLPHDDCAYLQKYKSACKIKSSLKSEHRPNIGSIRPMNVDRRELSAQATSCITIFPTTTMSTALHSARSSFRLSAMYRTARTLSSAAHVPVLPLQPPSLDAEAAEFETRTSEMQSFFSSSRFASLKRPYPPSAVASKQGSLPVLPLPSTLLADKLYNVLSAAAAEGKPVHTMGAIDPVQMTQMAKHQEVVYVSGWAASSVLTTGNNEVGPDLGYVFA